MSVADRHDDGVCLMGQDGLIHWRTHSRRSAPYIAGLTATRVPDCWKEHGYMHHKAMLAAGSLDRSAVTCLVCLQYALRGRK